MDAPSAADLQEWTQQDLLKNADGPTADRLTAIAVATFSSITGLALTDVQPALEPVVNQAIQGLAEMTAVQQSPDYLETLSDWDLIQSFSAGPYSETHRSADDARKARLIVAWPWLSTLLWGLLTPDKYDFWVQFFSGVNAPAFAVQEVDWAAGTDSPNVGWVSERGYFGV